MSQAHRVDPIQLTRVVRRATVVIGLVAVIYGFVRYGTEWVPEHTHTNDELPGGTWLLVDTWTGGLKPGADVLVDTPHGLMVSRATGVGEGTVFVEHPADPSSHPDSRAFGWLPRSAVQGIVIAGLRSDDGK